MSDKEAEIKRIEAAVKDMAKLMNGTFELDHLKLQAFLPQSPTPRCGNR